MITPSNKLLKLNTFPLNPQPEHQTNVITNGPKQTGVNYDMGANEMIVASFHGMFFVTLFDAFFL